MRLQDLKHLEATMEALTACVDVDVLLATLLAHTQQIFHMDVAFVWLAPDEGQLRLHLVQGVPPSEVSPLQRLQISATGARTVSKRLYRLGYHTVLAAPLRVHARIAGMVAAASRRSRRSLRTEAAIFKILVRAAVSSLERLQSLPMLEGEDAQQPTAAHGGRDVQNERLRLLDRLISGITHDLNNAMATISGRVELLLIRLHDQVTLQHLEMAQRAIDDAGQMIRHIHRLVSGYHDHGVTMVDINQLIRDSIQIARATWFQEFRRTRVPVDLAADLHPAPAFPAHAADLRMALLCLLRHAMDASPSGGGLMVRTWSEGEGEGQTVLISISDDPGPFAAAEREEGIGLLLRSLHSPESQRALELVEAIIRTLDGRITVSRSPGGGTTTTLIFHARRTSAVER